MTRTNVYLNFNDNCREAMTFYKDCFDADLTLTTVGESPMVTHMPAEMKDTILHASLKTGDNMIMGSDMRTKQLTDGDTVSICINCESEDDLYRFYKNLSAGGNINCPIGDMPQGAKIGTLTDKFGKHWMFYYDKNGN